MPVGGQRLVSRSGHVEHFGVVGAVGLGVGTGVVCGYVVCTGFVVGTTEVVVDVSWQAVGSGSSRISWNVAALAREAVRNARKEPRSIVLAEVCFEGWCLNMIS